VAGHTDHEVPNLLPRRSADGVLWYGVRLDYFLPDDSGFRGRPLDSFRLWIAAATSPAALAVAPGASLGSVLSDPGWGIDVDLAGLSPDLAACDLWNEPALAVVEPELFLVVRCLALASGGKPLPASSPQVVFATTAQGAPVTWRWRYVGRLAAADEAVELGGVGLTQIDLATGADGQLLAVLTPDSYSAQLGAFIHYGCRVVEVASLDPPALRRDGDGLLIVRAAVDASDLAPYGPGACSYDAASSTGVLLTRRLVSVGGLVADLRATGLRP
jgi:hypothetical protein